MVHMLAAGVFFSGFIKDLVCLPRPLSPPLQRISRSASVALEYGFPSTHSTNAVSVALYAIHSIHNSSTPFIHSHATALQCSFIFYAISIVFGRVYCGMHGLFDVVIGSALGALIALLQISFGPLFDTWITTGSLENIVVTTLIMLVLVRIHPEPADNCPCFDDSVAFSGVFIGIQVGCYHFAGSPHSIADPMPSTIPFSIDVLGLPISVLRILLGVLTVFTWRALAKPTLLRILPPIFRIAALLGLLLPRKFFLNVDQYHSVPNLKKDDNVIPPASEIPGMLSNLRHPRRRAVSVGPQSEADAYEVMAFRERKRRQSQGRDGMSPPLSPLVMEDHGVVRNSTHGEQTHQHKVENGGINASEEHANGDKTTANGTAREHIATFPRQPQNKDEADDEALFRALLRPRVRYDVEVVTKLIVYSGIAWISVEGNAHLFAFLGLAP
ncbi:MAG: hypothetical protein Q9162_000231 [Coniocarpon cinnabarinum]